MYRFVMLAVLSCTLLIQADVDIMQKCGRLLHPRGLSCCNKKYLSEGLMEEMKECRDISAKPPSCERELCMAKKKGYASDDGTIDKSKLKAALEKNEMNDSDLQQALIKDCVDGDLSKYGPPDFCDLRKLNMCMHQHLIMYCPDWSNDGECSGSTEAAAECIKALA